MVDEEIVAEARRLLEEHPEYLLQDARASTGNTLLGGILWLAHQVPRQYAEEAVQIALAARASYQVIRYAADGHQGEIDPLGTYTDGAVVHEAGTLKEARAWIRERGGGVFGRWDGQMWDEHDPEILEAWHESLEEGCGGYLIRCPSLPQHADEDEIEVRKAEDKLLQQHGIISVSWDRGSEQLVVEGEQGDLRRLDLWRMRRSPSPTALEATLIMLDDRYEIRLGGRLVRPPRRQRSGARAGRRGGGAAGGDGR